jgi:CHAD domain-containing protein
MLAAQRDEVLRHDVGIRADGDPDDVHEMRVAVRRLRAFLRAARPMLERRSADRLRADLDRLAGPLGAVRDLDVLLAGLAGEIASLDGREALDAPELLTILRGQRDAALARLLEFLESATYLALLAALDDAVDAPRIRDPDASLRRIARAEFRKLRKAVRALGDPPSDRALHKVRIRGKRARYAAELAEAKAGKRAGKLIAEAKRFQDVLGEHQDAVVATGALRGLGAESRASGATFAAGRLFERERLRRQEARAGFPRSWRRLKKAGKKAWG